MTTSPRGPPTHIGRGARRVPPQDATSAGARLPKYRPPRLSSTVRSTGRSRAPRVRRFVDHGGSGADRDDPTGRAVPVAAQDAALGRRRRARSGPGRPPRPQAPHPARLGRRLHLLRCRRGHRPARRPLRLERPEHLRGPRRPRPVARRSRLCLRVAAQAVAHGPGRRAVGRQHGVEQRGRRHPRRRLHPRRAPPLPIRRLGRLRLLCPDPVLLLDPAGPGLAVPRLRRLHDRPDDHRRRLGHVRTLPAPAPAVAARPGAARRDRGRTAGRAGAAPRPRGHRPRDARRARPPAHAAQRPRGRPGVPARRPAEGGRPRGRLSSARAPTRRSRTCARSSASCGPTTTERSRGGPSRRWPRSTPWSPSRARRA